MNTRRCTSKGCLVKANRPRLTTLDLPIATLLVNPRREWTRMARGGSRIAAGRSIDVDWGEYNQDNYIFAHSSIVCSVNTADNGYYIEPPCDELVNTNGNAWTKPVLTACFKTFVGAENYLEHCQIPELSKGKIIDAVLRPVKYASKNGQTAEVLYCDILVATHKKHADLVKKIVAGKMNTMSMGCGLAGTPITMSSGELRPIEEISVGDEVLTHTGAVSRVSRLFEHDVEDFPMHVLDVVGAPCIRLTAEHPVYVARRESVRCVYSGGSRPCKLNERQSQCWYSQNLAWKCAGKRKPCGRDKQTHQYDFGFVEIANVREGDYVVKAIPSETQDDAEFTPDLCRLLGLYAGDGYVGWHWDKKTKTKRSPAYVEFCLSLVEDELAEDILLLLSSITPNAEVRTREVPERNGRYIKVKDANLASFMNQHCGESCYTKEFSPLVMRLPVSKQAAIVGGALDTDGCYYERKGSLHFSTSSPTLWNQIHLLLLRMRVENSPSEVIRDGSGFAEGKKSVQYDVRINKKHAWKVEAIKNGSSTEPPEHSSSLCFFHGDYYMMPVKSNTMLRVSARVYNFAVERDESYLVSNVAVHNCLANIVTCSKCGTEIGDNDPNCECLNNQILDYFVDENGVRRIVAELCGRSYINDKGERVGDPESMRFIEASWVANPAWKAAVLNHYIGQVPKAAAAILDFPTARLQECVDDIFKLRVADRWGMMVLRVAWAELRRRKHEAMIDRVAGLI